MFREKNAWRCCSFSCIERSMVQNDLKERGNYSHFVVGGAVVSWSVRSSPNRAVWVRAMAGDSVLCSHSVSLHPIVLKFFEVHTWR